MRKTIPHITVFMLIGIVSLSNLFGQPDGSRSEKIKAFKVSYITSQLNLTSDEAQKFWPVYNEFETELEKIQKERRTEVFSKQEQIDGMSDNEIEAILDKKFELDLKEVQLRNKYLDKYKKVLPVRKVAKLYIAELKFKLILLEEIKKRKRQEQNNKHKRF
jgi:hypothetical protein